MSFEERLQNLSLMVETTISDKKFYMQHKMWENVSSCNRSLKLLEMRITDIRFHARQAAKAA